MAATDENVHLRNPSGRLFLFLKYFRDNGNPQGASLPIVCDYFGLPAVFSPTVFSLVTEMYQQSALMRTEVASLEDSHIPADELLEPLPQVDAAIDRIVMNLNAAASDARAQYHDGTLAQLKAASYILNRASAVKAGIPTDTLQDARAKADELIDLLNSDTTIDPKLREILYRHAEGVRRSIDIYKIAGLEAVLGEFDKFMGMLNRQPAVLEAVKSQSKVRKLVGNVLLTLNLIAAAGNATLALEHGADLIEQLATPTVTEAPATPPSQTA